MAIVHCTRSTRPSPHDPCAPEALGDWNCGLVSSRGDVVARINVCLVSVSLPLIFECEPHIVELIVPKENNLSKNHLVRNQHNLTRCS